MRCPRQTGGGAAALGDGPLRGRAPARRGTARNAPRAAPPLRLAAGTLCGLGATLFPGLALLAFQAVLVAVWGFVAVSLVVGGLRGRVYG